MQAAHAGEAIRETRTKKTKRKTKGSFSKGIKTYVHPRDQALSHLGRVPRCRPTLVHLAMASRASQYACQGSLGVPSPMFSPVCPLSTWASSMHCKTFSRRCVVDARAQGPEKRRKGGWRLRRRAWKRFVDGLPFFFQKSEKSC